MLHINKLCYEKCSPLCQVGNATHFIVIYNINFLHRLSTEKLILIYSNNYFIRIFSNNVTSIN